MKPVNLNQLSKYKNICLVMITICDSLVVWREKALPLAPDAALNIK